MSNVIEKIQKLLRLADETRGGTEAERDLAMQRAQELMLKHNLDYAAVHEQSAPGNVSDHDMIISGAMNQWKVLFFAAVGSACFVDTVIWHEAKHRKKLMLVGRPDNLAFVTTLTEHLIPWLEQECKMASVDEAQERGPEFFNPRAFKRSFMESATFRIRGRLHQARTASEVGEELIVHEGAANQQYLAEHVGELRKASRRRGSGESAGHAAGRAAGDRADISPGRKLSA